MATLGATNPTITDWTKMLEPNGGVTTDIVEMLKQENPILLDLTWMEANGPTYHRSTIRTGIPTPTWRQFYQGVDPSKSTYAQVDETMGMMEARSVVDVKLANLEANKDQFRLNEAAGQLEGMDQTMAAALVYGNVGTDPKTFNGLTPRFNLISATSGTNIIDAGGTSTDNTSIWLCGWSPRTGFGVFPKGSPAGVQREDKGVQEVLDANSKRYSAYEEKFMWDAGLVIKDWRYFVRIANVDVSDLVGESSAADVLKLMTKAVHKVPSLGGARFCFYANRTVATMLDIQAQNKANVYLTIGEEEGRPKVSFRGIPIRQVDQILDTEARCV